MSNLATNHPMNLAHQILDCFDDGVLLVDQGGTITSITPRCLSMIRSTEDWVGTNLWRFLPVNVLYSPCTVRNILAAFATSGSFEFDSFYTHVHRWFRFSMRPLEVGMVMFLRDITDQHVATAMHLRERNIALKALVSLIAHEINNPLQALTNLLVIARNDCTEPCIQDLLESAEREIARIGVATSETLRLQAKGFA